MHEGERVHILTHILLHKKNKYTFPWHWSDNIYLRGIYYVHTATMTQRFASSWHQFNHSHTWKQRQIHASSLKRVLICTPKKTHKYLGVLVYMPVNSIISYYLTPRLTLNPPVCMNTISWVKASNILIHAINYELARIKPVLNWANVSSRTLIGPTFLNWANFSSQT